ncbi:hypothetical protein COY87_04700 [Candidatus Roizmanbacteria bacterium CG_4_10_14_0_8_um_filter_33_9]|uniref:MIP18 family-like domain-containing protein n=1 Tax=Candidatus Roizmanbacteria bacterium CG_4_10_14_0_8_um_filter_33_9 TaxID=1974826 RepID=A0A2M7QHB1_9BACT|nr:MAG: hypothetical protein COY87_04700 [Candidatus Roizmanbacteria bacterium CG_4_10_14_0_8_um_filter_33_9]
MKITEKKVYACLNQVMDPELHMSIVDLGLIYRITIDKKNNIKILMTLTTIGCPLFGTIEEDMRKKLMQIKGGQVDIELVFDPPWSMDRMTERGKAILGI